MPQEIDAGVPVAQPLWAVSEQPRPELMPSWVTGWLLADLSAPKGPFWGTQQWGQWLPLMTEGVNPVVFVPRRPHVLEHLRPYFIFSGNRHFSNEEFAVWIRGPQAAAPEIRPALNVGVAVQSGESFLRAGRDGPAMTIEFRAESTDGSAGRLAVIHLIKSVRRIHTDQGGILERTTGGEYVLDNTREAQGFLYADRAVPVGVPCPFGDSPRLKLESYEFRVEVDEHFRTTLVFQSQQSPYASWVPLRTVEWGWRVDARKIGNAWNTDDQRTYCTVNDAPPPDILEWRACIHRIRYNVIPDPPIQRVD